MGQRSLNFDLQTRDIAANRSISLGKVEFPSDNEVSQRRSHVSHYDVSTTLRRWYCAQLLQQLILYTEGLLYIQLQRKKNIISFTVSNHRGGQTKKTRHYTVFTLLLKRIYLVIHTVTEFMMKYIYTYHV